LIHPSKGPAPSNYPLHVEILHRADIAALAPATSPILSPSVVDSSSIVGSFTISTSSASMKESYTFRTRLVFRGSAIRKAFE
jgi:hypothetical protein